MATGVGPPPLRSWWRHHAVIVVALVMIVAGAAMFALAPTSVTTYGWTAYTPLTTGPDFADFARKSYLTGQHLVGAGIALVGLIVLAGAVGYRLGARRRSA